MNVINFVVLIVALPFLRFLPINISNGIIQMNGCFVIKAFQWLKSRHDIEWISKDIFLHNKCHEIKHSMKVLKKYKLDIQLDGEPYLSGSIGQVYKCVDKNGQNVAVKIRHPDVLSEIIIPESFLKLLLRFSVLSKNVDVKKFIEKFHEQVDFRIESDNFNNFKRAFKDNNNIIIPDVIFAEEDIIITSWEDGTFLNDLDSQSKQTDSLILISIFMKSSLFVNGMVHSDLHIGNWSIRENPLQLVIYDCGYVSYIDATIISNLLNSYFNSDYKTFTEIMINESNLTQRDVDCEKISNICFSKTDFKRPCSIRKMVDICSREFRNHGIIINSDLINALFSFAIIENLFFKKGLVSTKTELYTQSEITDNYYSNLSREVALMDYIGGFEELKMVTKGNMKKLKPTTIFGTSKSCKSIDVSKFYERKIT